VQLHWHELIGLKVIGPDGATIGRLRDLTACRGGDDLHIISLVIGRRSMLARIWKPRWPTASTEIPWSRVESITRRGIRLHAKTAPVSP
jgi:sporulation protein YlmC with PRC-barrel domain